MGEIIHRHKYETSRSKHAEDLAREKAANTRAIRMKNEMLLAKARGELIEKRLVERQAAWLLIAMRQRMLAIPQAYTRQLLNISDAHVMSQKLREMALSVLNELQQMPEKVTDPDWLDRVEEENGEAA